MDEHRKRRAAERAEKQQLAAQLQVPGPCTAVLSSACALRFSSARVQSLMLACKHTPMMCVMHARPSAVRLQALAEADKERQARQAEAGRAAKAAKLAEQVPAALPCLCSSPSIFDKRDFEFLLTSTGQLQACAVREEARRRLAESRGPLEELWVHKKVLAEEQPAFNYLAAVK